MIKITFPDQKVKEFPKGTTGLEIAKSIHPGLAREVLSVTVNGELQDMMQPIESDSEIHFHKWEDEEGKHAFWHSSAHLMAEALEALYPGTKFGIGPAIDQGFYYDIDPGENVVISDTDLLTIEAKMKELAREKNRYIRKNVTKKEALAYFGGKGDEYKLELIDELEDGTISFYSQGNFTDLCRGRHLLNTEIIKAITLVSVARPSWLVPDLANQ